MSARDNADVTRAIFSAIERRDPQGILDRCDPAVEFIWPPSLPYGGTSWGVITDGPSWAATWMPLQPTEAERRMDPRVIAATDDEVVVLWRQRGVSPSGERCDTPVLGLYEIHDGKLVRAQMFYFDPVAVGEFLSNAMTGASRSRTGTHG
jgi:ketosteroid isomerase-like protein